MTSRHLVRALCILVTFAGALAACSKSASNGTASNTSGPSLQDALSPAAVASAVAAAHTQALPKPDPATPDEAYVQLNSGNQLMFLYAALSGLPPDFNAMARNYSQAYAQTTDEFQKHDLMLSLKPRMLHAIQEAKAHPYVVYEDDTPSIGHYNFATHAFPVGAAEFSGSGYVSYSDNNNYSLDFSNAEDFGQLRVNDEALAQRIEQMVSNFVPLKLRVFVFADDVDPSRQWVLARVVKVQLLDANDQVLLTQSAKS